MRQLTSEEVAKEERDILTRPWPRGSLLPVKNLYSNGGPRIGFIYRKDGVVDPIVHEESGFLTYDTIKAMIEAGWVAD